MTVTSPATIAPGTPVVIVGGPYGLVTRAEVTAPGVPRWREQTANDGDVAVYNGPHPSVEGWHVVHVLTLADGTELVGPLDPGMFTVSVPQVQIPGVAWTRVFDGDYPNEQPQRWARLQATSRTRRHGRIGWSRYVENARADDLADLYEYVHGVAAAMWSALGDQHGDPENYASVRSEAQACQRAADRLAIALAQVGIRAVDRFA